MAMLVFVFAAYLLLSLPVTGSAQAFASEHGGTAVIDLRAAGMCLRLEIKMTFGKKRKGRARGILTKALLRALILRRLYVNIRVGLGDAWQTALAAGGAKAAVFSLLGALPAPRDTQVIVTPDFVSSGLSVQLRCIFSACAGDIMLAAASAAIKKRRNEGLRWSSIPSRA